MSSLFFANFPQLACSAGPALALAWSSCAGIAEQDDPMDGSYVAPPSSPYFSDWSLDSSMDDKDDGDDDVPMADVVACPVRNPRHRARALLVKKRKAALVRAERSKARGKERKVREAFAREAPVMDVDSTESVVSYSPRLDTLLGLGLAFDDDATMDDLVLDPPTPTLSFTSSSPASSARSTPKLSPVAEVPPAVAPRKITLRDIFGEDYDEDDEDDDEDTDTKEVDDIDAELAWCAKTPSSPCNPVVKDIKHLGVGAAPSLSSQPAPCAFTRRPRPRATAAMLFPPAVTQAEDSLAGAARVQLDAERRKSAPTAFDAYTEDMAWAQAKAADWKVECAVCVGKCSCW